MKKVPLFPLFITIILIPLIGPVYRVVSNSLWLELPVWWPVLAWLAGSVAGYLVIQLDQLLDILVTNPQTNLAVTVRNYLARRHISYGLRLLSANKHLQPKLTFRSALFQLVWAGLAVFSFTSTPSAFGKGFIIGLGLHLLLEQWNYYLSNRGLLKQWLFWQIKRDVSQEELKWYLVVMSAITVLLVITVKI